MILTPLLSVWLLQAAAQLPDTVVAKTMPAQLGLFDYTSATLQIIVLILGIAVLVAMGVMLVALKRGLDKLTSTVDKLYTDSRPLVQQATLVAQDAREVVAMLRTDVERVTKAAGALSDQLLDVAEISERRLDEVNAVLDVVQGELEETVLSTAAALRGARVGGKALAGLVGLGRKRSARHRRNHDERRHRDAGD